MAGKQLVCKKADGAIYRRIVVQRADTSTKALLHLHLFHQQLHQSTPGFRSPIT